MTPKPTGLAFCSAGGARSPLLYMDVHWPRAHDLRVFIDPRGTCAQASKEGV